MYPCNTFEISLIGEFVIALSVILLPTLKAAKVYDKQSLKELQKISYELVCPISVHDYEKERPIAILI